MFDDATVPVTASASRAVAGGVALLTSRTSFLIALAFRVFIAVIAMRSADAPDEWYQSVEVAYYVVFGKGELTWEWRWGIRSFLYPLPIAVCFFVLKQLGLDSPFAVWVAPRLVAAVTCAALDWAMFAVARKYMYPSVQTSHVAYLLSLSAWYAAFIGCRTLTNTVEALMILLAMLPTSLHGFLFFAGLGCGMRATFALPLIPVLLQRVATMVADAQDRAVQHAPRHAGGRVGASGDALRQLRRQALARTLAVVAAQSAAWVVFWLAAIACVDYLFYGRWTVTTWAFLEFNVFKGLSRFFGVEPWWWYLPLVPLIVGVPSVLFLGLNHALTVGSKTPHHSVAIAAAATRHNNFMKLVLVVFVVLLVSYSALPHKELRFLFPALPPLLLLATGAFVHTPWLWRRRIILSQLFTVGFVGFAICTLVFYQTGAYASLAYIRSAPFPPTATPYPLNHTVHVWTPCHWSPSYSAVHGVVSDIVHNNCSTQLDPAVPPGAPARLLMTEHHFWLDHPLEYVLWIYDGVDPTESHPLAVEMRSSAEVLAMNDRRPSQRFMRRAGDGGPFPVAISDADMPALLKARVPPRSRTLPDRIITFDQDATFLHRHFLGPHGYVKETSVLHMPLDPPTRNGESRYVEIWQRRALA